MNEVAFIESKTPNWQRLSILTEKADASPKNLTADELQELIELYRSCSTDLAVVRTRSNNLQVIGFLNDLVARSYSTLYRPKRKPVGSAISESVSLVARTARRMKYFVLASVLTTIAAALFGFFACKASPALRQEIEPPETAELFSEWKTGKPPSRGVTESATASAFYASHNPLVSIITASVGAGTFGVMSAQSLWENGQMIGALSYEMSTVGKLGFLYASIMPHGVTELSGIILAGASGYQLGWALIAPGRRKRRDALKHAGKDALVMLCAAIVMMFMAAPVEGFLSFNPKVPTYFKVAFAIFGACAWAAFWIGYGRDVGEPVT